MVKSRSFDMSGFVIKMENPTSYSPRQLELDMQFGERKGDTEGMDDSSVPLDRSFPSIEANLLAAEENFNKLIPTKHLPTQVVGQKVRYNLPVYS
jgi:hypothetical protein